MTTQTIAEKIRQRRRQMIFHSVLYYKYDAILVEDEVFDRWAYELVDLQEKYPDESAGVEYAKEFSDWDGSTGFHLVEIGTRDKWADVLAQKYLAE